MRVETLESFAVMIRDILQSDRDVNVGVGGFTGAGKSTFSTKLQKQYAKVSGTYWGFDRMTWSRKELMTWIDGDKKDKEKVDGLRKGQLPEYSAILPDELFAMFYRRNWFDEGQIDAIATFNMCRDRHLFLCGNIPNFWDLDTAFTSRIRFYVYIPQRGFAWVFEQENNPFTQDNWNKLENKKLFRKKRTPYAIPNFVCQINFDDWDDNEKVDYLKIRNSKRLTAIDDSKSQKAERVSAIKVQRNNVIKFLYNYNETIVEVLNRYNNSDLFKELKEKELHKLFTLKTAGELTGLSIEGVRSIKMT